MKRTPKTACLLGLLLCLAACDSTPEDPPEDAYEDECAAVCVPPDGPCNASGYEEDCRDICKGSLKGRSEEEVECLLDRVAWNWSECTCYSVDCTRCVVSILGDYFSVYCYAVSECDPYKDNACLEYGIYGSICL
ncbi:MAG: hypothetical protein R3F14_31275 [Polyangiaceae bacterium]